MRKLKRTTNEKKIKGGGGGAKTPHTPLSPPAPWSLYKKNELQTKFYSENVMFRDDEPTQNGLPNNP